ncbi:hypothetical protein [Vibrio cincinnatiensis]|uniref:hypothetical protein n=1 Tax=Vibrio cincinnatiensis TaxID=675 RepID=UPI001EDD63D6|nr:hypothetical protein [Vibrio cincinnatiensis]MCG3731043.1 hypothetical protein [Vibrio cincinnatiensis]
MIDAVVFVVLIGFYFYFEGSETPLKEASIAIGTYGLYLVVYHLISPFPGLTSKYMGQLYGFLPMLSFGMILFPNLNTSSPEVVTKGMGWIGLITSFLILSYFKLFVW